MEEQKPQTTFAQIDAAPPDAIFGIKQLLAADERPDKIDLSIGVYLNNDGITPVLAVIEEAAARLSRRTLAGGYLAIEGLPEYLRGVQELLFGAGAAVIAEQRVVTAQSIGGTSALRYGADFLKRFYPAAVVYLSDPTWENHRAIFQRAGFQVAAYPYHDAGTKGVAFAGLCETLAQAAPQSIILLHANCHNPTGVDLDQAQWSALIDLMKERDLIPFIDFAYQGFADGIQEDAAAVRRCVEAGLCPLVANSFSKNFSLYRRRVGALSIVCGSAAEARSVLTQLRTDIRANNSNPPVDGAALVAAVLGDPLLRAKWEREVAVMRERIVAMRRRFVAGLTERGLGERFQHILRQRGMFSYSGLTKEEVERLRVEHAIYTVGSGRICLAAMTDSNVDRVAECVAEAASASA